MNGKRARWTGNDASRSVLRLLDLAFVIIVTGVLMQGAHATSQTLPAEIRQAEIVLAPPGMGRSDPPENAVAPRGHAVWPGVIGTEDRVPLDRFVPPNPGAMPGWERALRAVVQIDCRSSGGGYGTGVLLGRTDRLLTAAHLFLDEGGRPGFSVARCHVWHDDPVQRVGLRPESLQYGAWHIPEGLHTYFATEVTRHDWAIIDLTAPLTGAVALDLVSPADMPPPFGQAVLVGQGPNDSHPHDGLMAQVCWYLGPPPVSATLAPDGTAVNRMAAPDDALAVARTDCDAGVGTSGAPMIGWSADGHPAVWGLLSDSMRGRTYCPYPGYSTCFTAGPLAPVIGH